MIYTNKRTPQHAAILADVKAREQEKGIKMKSTPRDNHYYFDQTFDLSSDQTKKIAAMLGFNSFSYIGNLAVVSTEYPLDDQTLTDIQTIMRG